MEQTGMIRQFDEMGRVVIPKDIREQHGWGQGSPVEIIANNDYVIIKSYRPSEENQQDISNMKDNPSSKEIIIKLEDLIDRLK